jgi:hypothetical protein
LPVFAGFKIQNSIVALDNIYQAEAANAMQTERVAMQVVTTLVCIRHKTVELLKKIKKAPSNG